MKRTKFHVRRVSLLILVLGLGSLLHSALMNAADSIPSHLWSKRFGDIATDRAQAVVTDASGNVLVVGSFQGTVDFGGGGLTSAGDFDIFVAKFSPSGSHLWSKRFGSTGIDRARSIALDGNGNPVIGGAFSGTVDFGGGGLVSAGDLDIYVVKLSGADGSHLWSKRFGSTGADMGPVLQLDGSGNVLVEGNFQGTVDFGGGGLISAGDFDVFVAKFSGTDGSHIWSKRYGSTLADQGQSLAVDSGGNPVVIGQFQGTVDFGGGGLTSAGALDIFVAKFSGADGSHVWSKGYGSPSGDQGFGIAVDSSGNVFVSGEFHGTIDFGGGGLISAGDFDIFVAKLSGTNGSHVWSKRFGGTTTDLNLAIALDGSGNPIVTGGFMGTVDFGGGAYISAGDQDIYLLKLSGVDGSYVWSKQFGSTGTDQGVGITVDASGSIVAVGAFQGTVDFGGGGLTSAGDSDMFVLELGTPSGKRRAQVTST